MIPACLQLQKTPSTLGYIFAGREKNIYVYILELIQGASSWSQSCKGLRATVARDPSYIWFLREEEEADSIQYAAGFCCGGLGMAERAWALETLQPCSEPSHRGCDPIRSKGWGQCGPGAGGQPPLALHH